MKKDKMNVEYKKITVEIPFDTYLKAINYCYDQDRRCMYLCDLVNCALLSYFDNHKVWEFSVGEER